MAAEVRCVPAVAFMRKEQERVDQRASWMRADEAFFAAGACHVLAFALRDRRMSVDSEVVMIRPRRGLPGSHVYLRDGSWGFDFNGWTPEAELLAVNGAACGRRWQQWSCDPVVVDGSLAEFCRVHYHRPPSGFYGDVLARAERYLARFGLHPPSS